MTRKTALVVGASILAMVAALATWAATSNWWQADRCLDRHRERKASFVASASRIQWSWFALFAPAISSLPALSLSASSRRVSRIGSSGVVLGVALVLATRGNEGNGEKEEERT